ncbi:cation:proton antiporter [Variovorax sp. NFACC27]|uniref:Cation:proton antiporter n=1 Tax=Variovorax gossypii TaxID=1679495 RepID=A0A431TTQ0_9BURK|nr:MULTISPECIES: cation:proton antiporter [Variovorax]MDP9605143.1 Kef-type K+ transport system membrane component KefB [Variovorax paradoxus]SEF24227.1 Kef-type K+ transport system, membrane component KefB [Variovorax sp. NFACC28]SEG24770.1 Kef-type K+ transport system, membrane component KefB [Variovorax sp. NFACC29]SFC47201.1 Kef-type K+ transport system, membrane component KefB [Variovorax sp. NFACC26]SFF92547.1 Kef-type K+ transport system, membrane component KefB [Variovorax sp. NFACC27]
MSVTSLLLQLIVILVTARFCGWVLRHVGQPGVVGEMAAGLMLGPVVMGALFPSLHAQLFSKESLQGLSSLSTLGLVLFMFVVGLELRASKGVREQLRSAGYVGVLSVVVPMALGLAIAPALHPSLAPAGVGFWPFALFIAAALSITAFPVMARILKDRGMTRTPFGQLSLGAAAVVDVFAWILLAFVVAMVGAGEGYQGLLKITLGMAVVLAALFFGLKPAFAWLLRVKAPEGEPSTTVMAALMIGLLATSLATEWLHLHAVFGAFLFGACLPRDDRLLKSLTERIEPISIVVLMPLFFALAGLGTTPNAFSGASLGAMLLIVGVATVGKIAGGAAGARMAGYGWRDSLATGSLMNARGLMELIVMKIGLDAGLIGPELFTMLLVMALATTAMTGPLINLFIGRKPAVAADAAHAAKP